MTARLLMIALDGADGASLERWSADGTLPQLAVLRKHGKLKHLTAPDGSTDDSLWASFQYAQGPGGHGRYYHWQPLASGEWGMPHRDEKARDTFWDRQSAQGQRVAVIDIPKCREPRALNGIHLTDWLCHGRYFKSPRSYPPELAADVVAKFGPAPPSRCGYEVPPLSDVEVQEIVGNYRTGIARKLAAGLHYLAAESWDLFAIGFKEGHCCGHTLWNLSDRRHYAYDAARAARLGDPLLTVLRDLDAAVGELVAAAGPDASVVVFSTTGMEQNGALGHLMPGVVQRLNRMLGGTLLARGVRRFAWTIAPKMFLRPCQLVPHTDNCAALRINARGSARTKIIARVTAALRELTDADTGRTVVSEILSPSDLYPGAHAANLPDLLIQVVPGVLPRAIVSQRLGRIEADVPPARPGNHAPGGIAVFAGAAAGLAESVGSMQDFGPFAARSLQTEPSAHRKVMEAP